MSKKIIDLDSLVSFLDFLLLLLAISACVIFFYIALGCSQGEKELYQEEPVAMPTTCSHQRVVATDRCFRDYQGNMWCMMQYNQQVQSQELCFETGKKIIRNREENGQVL